MQLPSTKYQNNARLVVGTPIIYPDDVTLVCDTTLGPVTINLIDIPKDYWSTQWAMYIIDLGNSGTNNITINAGIGQLINGSASVVMNVNNSYAKITIGANYKYLSELSYGSGAGLGYSIIQDEGVSLPPRTIINFVGNGVTATDDGVSKTIVTIPGGIIYLTNSALLTLISTNAIIPGQLYMVTDPLYATLGVLLIGLKPNKVSLGGNGGFLNADYQKVGNYSGVPTFVSNVGIWYVAIPGIVNGSVVIYNNKHWLNITGVQTTNPPPLDAVNWQVLLPSLTTGYIEEWDIVKYRPNPNKVVYRADTRLNEVELHVDSKGNDTLLNFQWGRNQTIDNKLTGRNTYLATNTYSSVISNFFENSVFENATTLFELAGFIIGNRISGASIVKLQVYKGFFLNNIVHAGTINITFGETSSQINENFISGGTLTIQSLGSTSAFNNNVIDTNGLVNVEGLQAYNFIFNYIGNGALIEFIIMGDGLSTKQFSNNRVTGSGVHLTYPNPPTGYLDKSFDNKTASVGYSNFELDLNFADVTIWDTLGQLTIPNWMSPWIGIYRTLNSSVVPPVSKIVNAPILFPFIVYPSDTTTLPIQTTAVGVAILDEIVSNLAPGTITLVGRFNGWDKIAIERQLNVNGIQQITNYQ